MLKGILSLWLIFSLAGPALAQTQPRPGYVEPKTGIALPRALGPLRFAGIQKYPQPELGVSARYLAEPLIKADIYIYDMGIPNLGTGIRSPALKPQFQQAMNDIYAMEKRGRYQAVKMMGQNDMRIPTASGKIPALSAYFTYNQGPGEGVDYRGVRVSHLILTAYRGSFVKIRFTYPENLKPKGREALLQFLADFGKILK